MTATDPPTDRASDLGTDVAGALTHRTVPSAGPPQTARDACLVHIYPTGPRMGRRYPLAGPDLVIGREDECTVHNDDRSVSRRHARVGPDPAGGFAVEDLGSTNGTFVNDRPVVGSAPLADGDYLRCGNVLYRFLAGGNVEAEYHEEIHRLTVQDALTRTANRRALLEFLDREAARSRRHARPLSVVLLDIDHFKAVNDRHGHQAGDRVLRGVAAVVQPAVREEDLLARYGGEEFALVLVETRHAEAVAAAERVRGLVARAVFAVEAAEVRVTVSAGVATVCGDSTVGAAELLAAADRRLYAAKATGRDRVVGEADSTGRPPG